MIFKDDLYKSKAFLTPSIFWKELELEKAENFLQLRIDRKKEYKNQMMAIAEKGRRKWLV